MTGDACLNAEAEVLVMTTEVFRNMLLEDDQARLAGVAQAAHIRDVEGF